MSKESDLLARIEAFGGEIRMMVRTFDGRQFSHHADVPTDPASVIKLVLLAEAFRTLDLKESVTIPHDPKAAGWGILRQLPDPVSMSMLDVVTLMVVCSDNLASDFVLSRLDRRAMHEHLHELGMTSTSAWQGFGTSFAPADAVPDNTTTPADIVVLLEHIRRDGRMMDVLAKQNDRNILHYGAARDVKCFTKSGQAGRIRGDAGVLQWQSGGCCVAMLAIRNRDVPDFRELLTYDMELAPIAAAAYRWAL